MSMVDISQAERRIAERVDVGITQSLVVSEVGTGVSFSNVSEMMEFAKMMAVANSGVRKHLRGNPGACLAILTQALEWGMSPFAVANKSYFVNDQIAFESQLVQAVILKRAPIKGRIKFRFEGKGEQRICFASATLRDGTGEVEYESPIFSKITPKNSPLWKSDPDQQHCYYSGRALCRRHFPDVILGIVVDEEIERERPAIGPDRAVDVSPKLSLSGKLDAIAGMKDRQKEPQRAAEPDPKPAEPETPEPDWQAELNGYESTLASAGSDEEIGEGVSSYRDIWADAPEEIKGEAAKLEAAHRARIEREAA